MNDENPAEGLDLAADAARARADDAALAEACRKGDAEACRRFYRSYEGQVRRVLQRSLGSAGPGALDDLVQETFVKLFGSLDRFRGSSRLSTWIYRVTVNTALQHTRADGRRRRRDDAWHTEETTLGPGAVASPEAASLAAERAARVQALVQKLDPKKRMVLVLREAEGLPATEVAKILEIPAATVRTRLFHARREFLALAQRDPLLNSAAGEVA